MKQTKHLLQQGKITALKICSCHTQRQPTPSSLIQKEYVLSSNKRCICLPVGIQHLSVLRTTLEQWTSINLVTISIKTLCSTHNLFSPANSTETTKAGLSWLKPFSLTHFSWSIFINYSLWCIFSRHCQNAKVTFRPL